MKENSSVIPPCPGCPSCIVRSLFLPWQITANCPRLILCSGECQSSLQGLLNDGQNPDNEKHPSLGTVQCSAKTKGRPPRVSVGRRWVIYPDRGPRDKAMAPFAELCIIYSDEEIFDLSTPTREKTS